MILTDRLREWNGGVILQLCRAIRDHGLYEGSTSPRLLVLADALEEAGCEDVALLEQCRSRTQVLALIAAGDVDWLHAQCYADLHHAHSWIWDVLAEEKTRLEKAEEEAKRLEAEAVKAAHAPLVAGYQAELMAMSKAAYAEGERSRGYWLRQAALALGHAGYVSVRVVDRHTRRDPPPGEIWIRPSCGKIGRGRYDKSGRPLTSEELSALSPVEYSPVFA